MDNKHIIKEQKRSKRKTKTISIGLLVYLLYLLVVQFHFRIHIGELWNYLQKHKKKLSNYMKQRKRHKFIRLTN